MAQGFRLDQVDFDGVYEGRSLLSGASRSHRGTSAGRSPRLHLLCFADVGNDGFGLPMTVSQDDLRTHLGARWDIHGIDATDYVTSMTPATFERLGAERLSRTGLTIDPARVRTDEQGRILAAVWHLRAERA